MINWTQKKLNNCLKHWQKVLGLENWRIKVQFADPRDIEDFLGYKACACISISPTMENAVIKIGYQNFYDQDDIDLYGTDDIEFSLIHELLHIYFQGLDLDKEEKTQLTLETIINRMCRALLVSGRTEYETESNSR